MVVGCLIDSYKTQREYIVYYAAVTHILHHGGFWNTESGPSKSSFDSMRNDPCPR